MVTYSELQDRVERNVIDLPAAVVAAVPSLINSAMRSIQVKHNFKVMETKLSNQSTTIATRGLVALPANWKELRDVPFYVDNTSGRQVPLEWHQSETDVIGYFQTTDEGAPHILLLPETANDTGSWTIQVWPLPDGNSDYSDGEYRITIPYWRYVTALSAGGDTNWFTNNADLWLEYKATAMAFMIDWDEERAAVWAQLAKNEYDEVVLQDKRQWFAGVDTFVPHWRGVYSPKVRF